MKNNHKELFDKLLFNFVQETIDDSINVLCDYLAFLFAHNELCCENDEFECIHQYSEYIKDRIVECYNFNLEQGNIEEMRNIINE